MEAPILPSGLHWGPEGLELCSGGAPDSVRFIDVACGASRLRNSQSWVKRNYKTTYKYFSLVKM